MAIRLKRAYEPPDEADGERILVERLWPRGLTKAEARLDGWVKEVSPSQELRKWYGHEPEKWPEFQRRYAEELKSPGAQPLLDDLAARARKRTITFVYAAKDEERNSAALLKRVVEGR